MRDEKEEADKITVTFLICLVVLVTEVEESDIVQLVDYSECENSIGVYSMELWHDRQ